MIKKFLEKFGYILAILVITVVAAISMNLNSNKYGLSDMSLANVEALARSEGGDLCCYWVCGATYEYGEFGAGMIALNQNDCWDYVEGLCAASFTIQPCQ